MARLLPEALQFSWRTDHELVAAVRRGEDSAFEQLFSRYRTRIWSYVSGILRDADRAEDITAGGVHLGPAPAAGHRAPDRVQAVGLPDRQERLHRRVPARAAQPRGAARPARARPKAEPTICSRAPRALTSPSRASSSSMTCAAPSAGCRSFITGSSSCASWRDCRTARSATRLGMSRPVVESTLFRARRRLAEEYEELISGRRCERTRAVIDGWEGRTLRRLGVRETRQLVRHLAHCQPCRRHARLARTAGFPQPIVVTSPRLAPHPIPLASRRRPAAADGAPLATPGSDTLAVA